MGLELLEEADETLRDVSRSSDLRYQNEYADALNRVILCSSFSEAHLP